MHLSLYVISDVGSRQPTVDSSKILLDVSDVSDLSDKLLHILRKILQILVQRKDREAYTCLRSSSNYPYQSVSVRVSL